jgi:DNA (cytosine-5)-methyltransferase 1
MCEVLLVSKTAWSSKTCALTWKEKVTKSGRSIFQLQALAHPIKEKEFGLLPTPKARDHKGAEGKRVVKTSTGFSKIRKKSKVKYGASLNDVAEHLEMKMWRTPDAHCDRGASSKERMKMKLEKGMPISINDQVAHPNLMWPTPTVNDSKNNAGPSQFKRKGTNLNVAVAKRGTQGGSLNPTWVEWLMGYPAEYTDLKHWGTLSSPRSRKK